MNVKSWTVCLVEPNKFEGQIILDLLRNAGVDRVKMFHDHETAIDNLELYPANIVIAAFEMGEIDGATWTRGFRRNQKLANRKAAIFLTSGAFSRSMAEDCRHAGANALIGKPISGKVLLATINKVLTQPRPFIDAEGYVGPCRRAGIVTAGTTKKRRKADDSIAAPSAPTLEQAMQVLAAAAGAFSKDFAKRDGCETALRAVQGYAVNAGDGPLMRACAAFALQLSGSGSLRPEAVRAAVDECVSGVAELVVTPSGETHKREAIAERVRQAVGKAAMQRAA